MISDRAYQAASAASRPAVFLVVALLVLLSSVAAGCSGDPESLLGTWVSSEQGETLDFASDGRLFFTRSDGRVETLQWQADGENLAMGVPGGASRTLGYSIRGDVLTLSYPDEEPAEYRRLNLQER